MPRPYDRTTYDGRVVDELTKAALEATAKRLGYDLTITQGSYNAGGVSASAGTHDGGGVVDLSAWDHERKVLELRRTGFAAWYRPAIAGLWPAHIHAVLQGNLKLAPSAQRQVAAYRDGRNGLASNAPDDGPRAFVGNRFRWRRGGRRIDRARDLIDRARDVLSEGIRGYAVGPARKALGQAQAKLPEAK
jgi:hypothetical protein